MRIVALLAFFLSATAIGFADPTLTGRVADSEGAAIEGAMILIHWDSAGSTVWVKTNVGINHDLVIKTDRDGSFKVDLPPGFYDVFVAGMAFSPTCRKVRIKPGESQRIALTMRVDPLYSAEMGDRIEPVLPKR